MDIFSTLINRVFFIVFGFFALCILFVVGVFAVHYVINHFYLFLYGFIGFIVLFILYMVIGLHLDSKPKKKTKAKPRARKVK